MKKKTLAIDIGGTGIKMLILDANGKPISERLKFPTPKPATAKTILAVIKKMLAAHKAFDQVSVGFPGVVKNGRVLTAPNLDKSLEGYALQQAIQRLTKKPTRAINDADMQGMGDISGTGLEMVITLGTGMGSALFINGALVPNLELGHHPLHKDKTYEDLLGKKALEKNGKKRWNKDLQRAITCMQKIFNFDHLYIGGGHAAQINFKLPINASIASNLAGLWGGKRLWD